MLTDRRPILLANARIIDPARDFDGPGDVLIADGVIRDARRGIGAAGVPEGTDIVNCAGKIVAPGLIDMRAFVGEPGASHRETFASASQAAATGGITTIICQPDTSPVIDNSATVDFVLRRARDTAIVNIHPMAALTKGLRGEEMTEIGLLKAAGAVAFTDGDQQRHQRAGDAAGADLCPRFRRADRASHRRPRSGRRRRHERGRVRRSARSARHSQRRRSHHAGARHATGRADRRPLSRGLAELHRVAGNPAAGARCGPVGQRLGLDQSCHAERKRHRPVPDVPEIVAAAAHRGRPPRAGRSAWRPASIDVIMSDHNPQDVEVKRLPFAEAASGAIGLETMLPAAASANGSALTSTSCGLWSDMMTSTRPEATRFDQRAAGWSLQRRRAISGGYRYGPMSFSFSATWLIDAEALTGKAASRARLRGPSKDRCSSTTPRDSGRR